MWIVRRMIAKDLIMIWFKKDQACLLDGDSCNINPASNDPHDCIMSNYNEPSADGKYYVGDEDQGEIIKSLNCERFKYGNTSRGTFMYNVRWPYR